MLSEVNVSLPCGGLTSVNNEHPLKQTSENQAAFLGASAQMEKLNFRLIFFKYLDFKLHCDIIALRK